MALTIISAAEPITVDTIVLVIYSPPGLGKTSTAYTADAPLLLDTDTGSHRSAFRKDTVRPATWAEIADITAEDVEPYQTLVLDTAGRALDLLSTDIIKKDAKMGRGGALTLQGYGKLKSRFAAYLNLMRSFGLDIVLTAHSDETQQGDEIIERIDMTGSSKQEVYKSSDAMARILIDGGRRFLSFSPTDTAFGKDPAALGRVEVPDFNKDGDFLADMIATIKGKLNEATAEQAAAVEALEEWKEEVAEVETPDDLTALIKKAGSDRPKKEALVAEAEERGWTYDKGAKGFVDPDADDEDDADAEAAEDGNEDEDEAPEPEKKAKPKKKAAKKKEDDEPKTVTAAQLKRFHAMAKGAGYTDAGKSAMLLDRFGIESSKDITRDIYEDVCEAAGDEDDAEEYNAVEDEEVELDGEGQSSMPF